MEEALSKVEARIQDTVDRYQKAFTRNVDINVIMLLQNELHYLREIRDKLINQKAA